MTHKKQDSQISTLLWLLLATAALPFFGCGGGGSGPNNQPPGAVSLTATIDSGQLLQVEMVKDIVPETITVTATASGNLGTQINQTAGTIDVDTYEITFTRQDGGVTLPTITGGVGQTVSIATGTGVPQSVTFSLTVVNSNDKLFSEFAADFAANGYAPVDFDCVLTLRGTTRSGDAKTRTVRFNLEAAVQEPVDELLPNIDLLNMTVGLFKGDDFWANWVTSGRVDSGVFILPWGDTLNIPGTSDFFPIGGITTTTSFLPIDPGTSFEYPPGVLVVSNPWGSTMSTFSDQVVVTNPPLPDPEPIEPVTIEQFFPDKTAVTLGEEVTLTWVTTGDPTQMEILPAEYSGIPVDFTGKDLSFGSVTIVPDQTIQPILRASRGTEANAVAFLSAPITVTIPDPDPIPDAQILFFQANRTTVNVGRQVVFYWALAGAIDRVDLFPFNGNVIDVTGLTAFVAPPLLEERIYTFSLVAYGTNGSIAKQDINIIATQNVNLPVTISQLTQLPSAAIDNNDDASFSFRITDPERRDSSWRVRQVAGDASSFFPREDIVPNGLGDATVSVNDFIDNDNGFLTYELSAYDDEIFGFGSASTRTVQLVNFNTTGQHSNTAPTISNLIFTPSGPDTSPGIEGSITFDFQDPDTLDLRWSIRIVAGDFGGSFTQTTGTTNTGAGQIQITYNDDTDTPTEPVIFLVRVEELAGAENPQSAIETLLVDKGPSDPGTTNPTGAPINFLFAGLYGNFAGNPDPPDALSNFTIFTDGNLANPKFYRNPDLSGEIVGVSYIIDASHESGDPSVINSGSFDRAFATPGSTPKNTGDLTFSGFFANGGDTGAPSATPIVNGVARYRMSFTIEDFRADGGASYNLPTTGSMTYNVTISIGDTSGNVETLTKSFTVTVP